MQDSFLSHPSLEGGLVKTSARLRRRFGLLTNFVVVVGSQSLQFPLQSWRFVKSSTSFMRILILHRASFIESNFITPIPRAYTSSPPDDVARNFLFSFYIHGYARSHNFSSLDPFFQPLMPLERKTLRSELESNPGPLASQATTLTTRPCLLNRVSSCRCHSRVAATVAQIAWKSLNTCLR